MPTKEKENLIDNKKVIAVISIVFGILVIIRPDVLGALVGVFLIITGVIALFHVRW